MQVGAVSAVVFRDGEQVFAAERRCPHAGADLAEGVVSRGHLVCPLHLWRFEAATGERIVEFRRGPGPADVVVERWPQDCLVTYATRVVGDWIELDPTPLRPSGADAAGPADD